jgi:hypothetical protein
MIKLLTALAFTVLVFAALSSCGSDSSDPIAVNGHTVSCVYGGLPATVTIGAGAPAGSIPPGIYSINKICTKCDKVLPVPCQTLIPFPGRVKNIPIPGLTTVANISSPFFTNGLSITINTSPDDPNCSSCNADALGTGLHVKDLKADPQSFLGIYAGTNYTGSPTQLQ